MSAPLDLAAVKARCEAANPGPWLPVVPCRKDLTDTFGEIIESQPLFENGGA